MSVVFWILLVLLMLAFFDLLVQCTKNDRKQNDRLVDLFSVVVVFVMILVLNNFWR